MRRNKLWSLLLVASIATLVLAACSDDEDTSEEAATEEEAMEEEAADEEMMAVPAIEVEDQDVSDGTVVVKSAYSDGPGWVVIHIDVDGSFANVIGNAPLADGDNTNVVVDIDLDSATPKLYAMLHTDAGTAGEYEFPGDDAPVFVDDEIVSPAFNAALQSSVSVSDQPVVNDTVTIDRVVAAEAGWLVIHIEKDGTFANVIGKAPVAAGVNTDVVVEIDSMQATETLYAMLHLDAGTIGEYEFPGDDAPVFVDDEIVSPAFNAALQPSVSVSDQPVVNETVTIDRVVAAEAGWLVIHIEKDGSFANVIGNAPVAAGVNTNVVVEIEGMQATDTLFAMLHTDAGTIGEYEFPGDDGPVFVDDEIVSPAFNTAVDPSVTVADQAISGMGTVTIANAIILEDGWMVIHAQADGSIGPVIGNAPLSAGLNQNVSVEIDVDAATDVLYAMLHVDAGTIGEYEFPGDDAPVIFDGAPVSPPFNVTT